MSGDLFGFNVTATHGARLVARLRGDPSTPHDDAARAAHVDVLERLEPGPDPSPEPAPVALERDTTYPELGAAVAAARAPHERMLVAAFTAAAGDGSAAEFGDAWRDADRAIGLALALAVAGYGFAMRGWVRGDEHPPRAVLFSHARLFLVTTRHGARRIAATVYETRGWPEPMGLGWLPHRT